MEFLAALAAGHNSQLMVMASAESCGAATLAMVCASWQTGGRVVCILCSVEEVAASRKALGQSAKSVEFAVGDARKLLSSEYKTADFVLMDCKLASEHERGFSPVGGGGGSGGLVCVGTRFLPMGGGLVVARIPGVDHVKGKRGWVFEVDESTGEEHFYKINSSYLK